MAEVKENRCMKAPIGDRRSRSEAAFYALLRTIGLIRQVMDPYFARFGISGSQWGMLRVLQRAETNGERGLRLSDLSDRLFIQPPSVTRAVDRLEREGLVQRQGSQSDLRVRRVSLTTKGKELADRILSEHRGQIESLFAASAPEELDTLLLLLGNLERHLARLAQEHPALIAAAEA